MKKTILLTSFMISFIWQSFSYTLSKNINWYNITWIVSGIYTETEFHSNLTSTASTIKSAICPAPDALTATDIMANTANLGWTENGTATAWDIEIVTDGETATGNSTFSGVTNNPHTVSNLTANTAYDFYVRANCGNEGTSNWVGPLTFTTSCETIEEAPYVELFETFTTEFDIPFYLENCWRGAINSANTGAYFWKPVAGNDLGSANTGPHSSITAGNYFYTEADNSNAGDIAELVTPLIDLATLTTPALTFNYHMYGDQIGTLDVLVNGTDNVWSLSGEQHTYATTPWRLAVIDLANYVGDTISVTFKATSEGRPKGDIAIDVVSFIELPTCHPPNTLTATNITTTTASLRWNENGTATSWNIELVNVTAGETVTGTPTTLGVTNPYTATNLIADNNYEFYVQADCGNDNGVSSWVGPFSFSTAYAVVDPTCSNGIFLDSGGQSNNYSNDETITYTICPENEGDVVVVYFTSFEIESGLFDCVDGLTIYDGEDNTATTIDPPLGGTMWCFTRDFFGLGTGDLQGMTISSTDASGCLTFVFTSDETITYSGWTATVSCNSLSADDVDNSVTFTYFPNPVKNTLTFSALNKIESIIVYNMLGQETIKAVPNALESTLDMSGLEIGTYFMKVTIQNSTQTIRIVKE